MSVPQHVVIIPDGNRRWAKKRNLPSFMGHRAGAKTADTIIRAALHAGVPCFTFWGSSLDNVVKRESLEVRFLFSVFKQYFAKLARDREIHASRVRVQAVGRWEQIFPSWVKQTIHATMEKTKQYENHVLTILLAYSGIDEMTDAVGRIAELARRQDDIKIDGPLIKQHLWTRDLPPVDLVIRTGGEPHWSTGLLMWDVADAQLYFTKTLWPDFSENEFTAALDEYAKITRRFGK